MKKLVQTRVAAVLKVEEPGFSPRRERSIAFLGWQDYPKNEKELIAIALTFFERFPNSTVYTDLIFEVHSLTTLTFYAKASSYTKHSCARQPKPDLPIANYEKYKVKVYDVHEDLLEVPKLEAFITSKLPLLRATAKKKINGNSST